MSGAVHKREINKEGAKAVKKEEARGRKDGYNWTEDAHKENMEDAPEQRNELERRNGGAARITKRRRHRNRGHTQGKHGRRTRSHT